MFVTNNLLKHQQKKQVARATRSPHRGSTTDQVHNPVSTQGGNRWGRSGPRCVDKKGQKNILDKKNPTHRQTSSGCNRCWSCAAFSCCKSPLDLRVCEREREMQQSSVLVSTVTASHGSRFLNRFISSDDRTTFTSRLWSPDRSYVCASEWCMSTVNLQKSEKRLQNLIQNFPVFKFSVSEHPWFTANRSWSLRI